jgi:acid phosphatase type 7
VLELTRHPKSYEWEFVPVAGETFSDSGSARCH